MTALTTLALTKFLAGRFVSACGSVAVVPEDTRAPLQKYCPHTPTAKQRLFLSLNCEEAFFGGAAGGGKSDVLLMSALQYVHVPGYAALILRRDYPRLSLAGAIMDRAKEWLSRSNDAHWSDKTVTFPSGAKVQFGYIDNPQDRYRYASSEYQFIGWDELTEFSLADDESNPYLFMFSRLRANNDVPVPLRMRSASNPGNIGHAWVKKRFIPPAFRGIEKGDVSAIDVEGRKFIPSAIYDNPNINEERYKQSLMHLPQVTRARLMAGDWSVAESLQIPDVWMLPFTMRGQMLCPCGKPGDNGEPGPALQPIDERQCRRFATVDTAGTSRDKAEETRGKPPSWSVVSIWDWDRQHKRLFLRHVWRERVGWNELKLKVPEVLRLHGCTRVKVENAHVGQPLVDEMRTAGIPAELVGPMLPGMIDGWRGAKLERAIASGFLTMLEAGQVFFPHTADWWPTYQLELTSWTGDPEQTSDQIDTSSYAAWEVKQSASSWGGVIK